MHIGRRLHHELGKRSSSCSSIPTTSSSGLSHLALLFFLLVHITLLTSVFERFFNVIFQLGQILPLFPLFSTPWYLLAVLILVIFVGRDGYSIWATLLMNCGISSGAAKVRNFFADSRQPSVIVFFALSRFWAGPLQSTLPTQFALQMAEVFCVHQAKLVAIGCFSIFCIHL